MTYRGPERRRHRLIVTRNTEYHLRDDVCVAVRDRRTGEWLERHEAVGTRLAGAIAFTAEGGAIPNAGAPRLGDSLCFGGSHKDLVTSPVVAVARPPKDAMRYYLR